MAASIIILMLFSFVDLILGTVTSYPSEIISYFINIENLQPENLTIIHEFKIPKLLTAIFAGAALSVAGLLMQTVFRNPLAGPYVLGISSGAGLGVALLLLGSTLLPFTTNITNSWSIVAAAWGGSALVLLIIFLASIKVKDVVTILIIGVLVGSAISAFISLLQYVGDANKLKSFVIWTMGSLSDVTNETLKILIPVVLLGLIISFLMVRVLDTLLLGNDYAKSLGVNLVVTRILLFLSTSLLAGTITAFCGPIGFVGIIVPHFARMLFKTSSHAILIPASAILGAIMIVISDIISILPGGGAVLPINSVTAVLGIPILLKIIIQKKGI